MFCTRQSLARRLAGE